MTIIAIEFNNSIFNNEQKVFLFEKKKYNPEQYQYLFCIRLEKYYN